MNSLEQWLATFSPVGWGVVVVVILLVLVVTVRSVEVFRHYQEERRAQAGDERARYYLAVEGRRLDEANVVVSSRLELLSPPAAGQSASPPPAAPPRPFLIFHLPLRNEGDGPVDIWASLVSARVLSHIHKPGIGLRSRDVEWSDYQSYFWSHDDPASPFAGISTTKNMLARPSHYIRLAAHERASLRRIDAINDVTTFTQATPMHVMYRVFVVIRGYPLGEILRQLGGGPPDPLKNVDLNQVQFRALAQPSYTRWLAVQRALLHVNRLAFRLATDEEDPLGKLTEQDAWRFFLLHHQELASVETEELLDRAKAEVLRLFRDLVLPPNFRQHPQFSDLVQTCRDILKPMIEEWDRLIGVIKACERYSRKTPYTQVDIPDEMRLPVPKDCPDEGYPVRIHQDRRYHDRWLELLGEGYLLSRPFAQKKRGILQRNGYEDYTIPDDPRVLEPFAMRIHYFLRTVN